MAYISMGHSLPAVNQNTTSLTASVWADMCLSSGDSLGGLHMRSWSGHWGSGSNQIDVGYMTGGQCIRIVSGGGAAVTLTDVAQTRVFAASMQLPWGTVSGSRTVTYPARYARTPTALTVTRNSDTQHTLNWTRNSTYSSVVVQRRTNDGDWQTVGQPTGNPASFIDTTTLPNRKYEYRVAGVGGSGQSPWSSTVVVFTTPAPPSSVTAQKVGFNIEVNASGLPPWWDSFAIEDNGSIIQSGVVTFPWMHVAPSSGSPHTYRVRAVKGSLVSGWSTPSNTVQLLAAPNAPTNLAPNGITANADVPIRLSWVHTPVDTTAQSAYELRWRVGLAAWTTLSGTVDQFRDVTLPVGVSIEWQVRTKGQHPDWSPWSASAFFDAIAQPGIAITQPGASWDQPTLPMTWTWFQADGRPQSNWQAQLLDAGDVLLESRSAPDSATSVTFNTRLEHNQQYTVRVRGQAGNVWSEWAEQLFLVEFAAPAPALFSGEWDEGLGAMNITACEGRGPEHPDVTNLFTNPDLLPAAKTEVARNLFTNPRLEGDGTWAEVRRNLATNPRSTAYMNKPIGFGNDRFTLDTNYSIMNLSGAELEGNSFDKGIRADFTQQGTGDRGFNVAGNPQVATPNTSTYDYIPVTPDVPIQISCYTSGNWIPRMRYRYRFIDSGGAWLGGLFESTPSIGEHILPASWYKHSAVIVPPPGAVLMSVIFTTVDLTPDTSRGTVATGLYVGSPGPYFDGSSPQGSIDPDMRQRWLGAANASESVMEIERVRGLEPIRCIAGVSTWGGKPAVRVIPTHATNPTSYFMITMPVAAQSGGTLLGTAHVDAPLTGVLDSSAMRLRSYFPIEVSEVVPNVAGSYPQRLAYSSRTSDFIIQYFHGGLIGSGDVWWTDIALIAGSYEGQAFTGSDPETRTTDYEWAGAVDNSESIKRSNAAEVARNLCVQPILSGSLTLWDVRSGVSHAGVPGGREFSAPGGVLPSDFVTSITSAPHRPAVTSADVIRQYVRVRNTGSVSISVAMRLNSRDASALISGANGASVTIAPGDSELLSQEYITPSGALSVEVLLVGGTGSIPAGAVFVVEDGWTVTKNDPRPLLFDGSAMDMSMVRPEDFRTRWLGATNASESVMEGEQVAGLSPNNCVCIVSTWDGQPAVRLIPTSASNDSYATINIPPAAQGGGTILGTVHQDGPLVTPLTGQSRRLAAWLPETISPPVPNLAGSTEARVVYSALSSVYRVSLQHGGALGSGDVWWTGIGLFAGSYDGPWFSGSSEPFFLGDSYMVPKWDGAEDASTSTAEHGPATVLVDIERSVDDGGTWEPVVTGATWDEEGCVSVSDFESLSCGITHYRVTTHAASEAATAEVSEVMSSSQAIWLGTGSGFQLTARLPYDPMITNDRGRRRVVEEYEGREVGIAYASQRRTNTLTLAGTILDHDETAATRERLESIIDAYYPVHLYRDMHGRRVYGVVSTLTENRLGVRRVCEATCDAGVWTYGFALAESSRD